MTSQDFLIIASGWNCKDFVRDCVQSISKQKASGRIDAVFISDGSNDGTDMEIIRWTKFFEPKTGVNFHAHIYSENMGATCRRHKAIERLNPSNETVIVFVGLDDELANGCIKEIEKQYQAGKWMTYGNWKNQQGKGLPQWFDLEFPDEIHALRDYRKVLYRSTAPNTFKAKLYKKIPVADLFIDGQWIQTCTEGEVMFSCLEMCGKDRIGIIKKAIYKYNQHRRTGSIKRFGSIKQDVLKIITSRPKRKLFEDL